MMKKFLLLTAAAFFAVNSFAAENKTAENKTAENKTAENKTAENKTAENKTAENKTAENKVVIKKDKYIAVFEGLSLEIPKSGAAPAGALATFYLPVVAKFAPNITIIKQPFNGPLALYDKVSREGMKNLKWTILKVGKIPNGLTYNYKGMQNNQELHYYSKVLQVAGFVYLVTAVAPESHWTSLKDQLMTAVNSLKLDKLAEK